MYVTLGDTKQRITSISTDDSEWLELLRASGWREVNPYSFLSQFELWWDFELRVRGLPSKAVSWSVSVMAG